MIRNIIFDVDGTLWDSAAAVTDSWNEVLKKYYPEISRVITVKDMYEQMGKTMYEIGRSLFPDLSEEKRKEIMDRSMAYENEYLETHSGIFYEGLEETLQSLSSEYRFFIVSNCQDGYIQSLLKHGHYSLFFDDFECFGRTGKPKNESIEILMERDSLKKDETLYLGDTAMDETAADKAGIGFIHAAYGFGTAVSPVAVIKDIRDLPAAVNALDSK